MSDIERVEEIRFFLKLNKKSFSEVLGYSHPQSYTKCLSGTSNLSLSALKSLKAYNNEFDVNWIITGQGSMFLSESSPKEASDLELKVKHLEERLKDKEEVIQNQRDLIESLKK